MRVESSFTETIFGGLTRADQRHWAGVYLEGLLSTPGKKSIRRLAATRSDEESAVLSLQQFLNASPWDWEPVLEEVIRWTERRAAPDAWTVGVAVQPKRGQYSAGVHRRFVPTAGRSVNCQMGLGVFLSVEQAAGVQIPVDWRLFLPRPWCTDAELRERARVPVQAGCRPPWAYVLDLVETLAARSAAAPPPLVADLRDLDDVDPLLRELAARGQGFVIAVPDTQRVAPLLAPAGPLGAPGAPPAAGPAGVRDVLSSPAWQHGRGGAHRRSMTAARHGRGQGLLVRTANAPGTPESAGRHPLRLFTEGWAQGDGSRIWLTNLLDRPAAELLRLAALADANRRTLDELESDFGLTAYEGRSYPGWHHHMTLMSVAYAYARLDGSHPRCAAPRLLPA